MICSNEFSFTKVRNILMDALGVYQGTALKHQILVHLIRRTAGFHRDSVLTSAAAIASSIRRNKAKTRQALHELIECEIVIADSKEGPGRTRRLSINMNTFQWHLNTVPDDTEEYDPDQKCSTGKPENEEILSKQSLFKPYREVSSERAQMDTSHSDSGSIKEPLPGSSESLHAGYISKPAYIDGKNENFWPKENIKENNKRNIYMYDITLIPPTLAEMPGFMKSFNEWCIYRQEIEKPLTGIMIDVQMRKLLLYSSEGFNVISIIENSISAGWPDLYRPGTRQQESPSKTLVIKTIEELENESY